jgi:bacterioferritin
MSNLLSLSGTRMRPGDLAPRNAADGQDNVAMAIRLLHEALQIARGVAARCERQYCAGLRHRSPGLAGAALEHANEAQLHAQSLAARITALGGTPAESAATGAPRVPAESRDGNSLVALIGGYLVTEHATIESYRQIATQLEPSDRPTQVLLQGIVAGEEERASRLAALLEQASAPPA